MKLNTKHIITTTSIFASLGISHGTYLDTAAADSNAVTVCQRINDSGKNLTRLQALKISMSGKCDKGYKKRFDLLTPDGIKNLIANYLVENLEQALPGTQGIQGEKGDKGDTGERGPKGDKGDTGDRGFEGPQGLPGIQGIQGQQGQKGDKGDKGDTGPQGPTGRNGTVDIAACYMDFVTKPSDQKKSDVSLNCKNTYYMLQYFPSYSSDTAWMRSATPLFLNSTTNELAHYPVGVRVLGYGYDNTYDVTLTIQCCPKPIQITESLSENLK